MTESVSFDSEGMAAFKCPKCQMTRTADISKYRGAKTAVKMNCKCKCGHTFKVLVERRRQKRIKTNLSGIYICVGPGEENGHGFITVSNISHSGVRFKLNPPLDVGRCDKLIVVCFQDDHDQRTLIKEDGIIRNQNRATIGVEFCPEDAADRSLEFYLYRQ